MIDKKEILEKAGEYSLEPRVIEKDYVLGWLLAGIANHNDLKDKWMFKGGTCLKKCYFETYRFSEDLDFTLLDATHLNEEFLKKVFGEIVEWVYEKSGIDIAADGKFAPIKIEIFANLRGNDSGQGNIYYRGPISVGQNWSAPAIKLDLTVDEKVVLEPVKMEITHDYSDRDENLFSALCYHYIDLFAEKTRALDERKRPGARDLYDVVNMHRHGIKVDLDKLNNSLKEKCGFKGIPVPNMNLMNAKQEEFRVQWEKQLKHQLPKLPPFESYWSELPKFFDWLAGNLASQKPLATITNSGSRNYIFNQKLNLVQSIRFAAASHLRIGLDYHNEKGERKQYILEPYSFRTTSENNVTLFAIDKSRPEHARQFRIDRMISVTVTNEIFDPRYTIEIVEDGNIHAPQISSSRAINFSPRSFSVKSRTSRATTRSGITYIYQCSSCNKKFRKKKMSGKLNKHKDRQGYSCYGRFGHFVETKYN